MKRFFCLKGDKTTAGGTLTEGIECFVVSNLSIGFHGASVFCAACGTTGHILCIEPRLDITLPNGKMPAAHGDLCLCKCNPPPTLIASQSVFSMTVGGASTAAAAASAAAAVAGAVAATTISTMANYDEQFRLLTGDGTPVANTRYKIVSASGAFITGTTDAQGKTSRVTTASAEALQIYWVN